MSDGNTSDLESLIHGCIRGERKSQHLIFKKLYGKMMGVCYRYTQNEDEAKDVLQESFIKVFNNIIHYGDKGSFEGWVRRIVVNTSIDFYRKKAKDRMSKANVEDIETIKDTFSEDEQEDLKYASYSIQMVMEKMKDLSPAYQMVFNLYVVEGLSHKEIAEELGISEGTSKSNLAKAKRNLKELLLDKTS